MDKSFTKNHHEPYSTKQVTARDVGAIISILKDILLILLLFLLFVFETIYRLTIQSLLDSKNNLVELSERV